MTEYTVDIETAEGTIPVATIDPGAVLDRVTELLEESGEVLDPSVSVNTRTGVVGATFQVTASNALEAGRRAVRAVDQALGEAGVDDVSGRVGVEFEVETITIAATRNGDPTKHSLVGAAS